MKIPSIHLAIEQTIERLQDVLDAPASDITCELDYGHVRCDAIVSVGRHTFALEWKRSGTLGQIAPTANRLRQETKNARSRLIPLVSVPYMGMRGRSYCERLGVSWMDLSGNSYIKGRNLFVR